MVVPLALLQRCIGWYIGQARPNVPDHGGAWVAAVQLVLTFVAGLTYFALCLRHWHSESDKDDNRVLVITLSGIFILSCLLNGEHESNNDNSSHV